MKKFPLKRTLSAILCSALIAAMALTATACSNETPENEIQLYSSTADEFQYVSGTVNTEATTLGEGQTAFALNVVDKDGNVSAFAINTDKETVGDALLELELISGEEGAYGLYVKTVNGITADYDTDGSYWAFYINGEYATSGVDTTTITDGATYELKVQK